MMLTASTAACVHWHYSLAKEEDPKLERLESSAHEAEKAAGWAIIDAAYCNPTAHLGDLAVLLRCRHQPDGGSLDPTMYGPKVEEIALLDLVSALLALGGVNQESCDQRRPHDAAKTSGIKLSSPALCAKRRL
jgi:hypothetical protein